MLIDNESIWFFSLNRPCMLSVEVLSSFSKVLKWKVCNRSLLRSLPSQFVSLVLAYIIRSYQRQEMQCLKNYQVPLSEVKIICRSQGIWFIDTDWEKKKQFCFLPPKKSSAIWLRFCYVRVSRVLMINTYL